MPRKKYPYRSKKRMTYHARVGYPIIHATQKERKYIMVRKSGGGTKRLYLEKGQVPKKHRKKVR